MKLAAIESEWHTEKPPASFTLFGWPDEKTETTDYAIRIPYVLGLIATRSTDTPVEGIVDLRNANRQRIESGMLAYSALQDIKHGRATPLIRQVFEQHKHDLGYGLLLKKYTDNPAQATAQQIDRAAADTVPAIAPIFWSFRVMVGLGFFFLFLFGAAFYLCASRHSCDRRRGCSNWRCTAFPCHGSPRSSAGSSPNSDVSPGPSAASCPPFSAPPACPAAIFTSASPASSVSIPCC